MTDMTHATPADGDAGRQWLDASVRQCLVELALAGAHHGMAHEARTILTALPSLVPDPDTCRWLQAALSIALGDTVAASGLLAEARNGAPAAIGAKIAFPDRMVIGFVGDGGFLMTGQEMATAFHHGVAPIFLVFNNQMYGTIRMYQERTYPHRVSGTALTNPDFAKFIEAYGGHGEVVTRTDEFAPAFRRAVESGRPALIELRTDPEQITSRQTIADLRAASGASKPPAAAAKRAATKRPTPARKTAPAKKR